MPTLGSRLESSTCKHPETIRNARQSTTPKRCPTDPSVHCRLRPRVPFGCLAPIPTSMPHLARRPHLQPGSPVARRGSGVLEEADLSISISISISITRPAVLRMISSSARSPLSSSCPRRSRSLVAQLLALIALLIQERREPSSTSLPLELSPSIFDLWVCSISIYDLDLTAWGMNSASTSGGGICERGGLL